VVHFSGTRSVPRVFPLPPQRVPHEEKYTIDLSVWYGSHYTTQLGIHDAAKELEGIGKTLKGWSHGFDGINAYTTDRERYEEQQKEWIKQRMEEARREKGEQSL
jgi:hypothetical protein